MPELRLPTAEPIVAIPFGDAARADRFGSPTQSGADYFDEPLSGLDATSARLFKDLLSLLAKEGKVVLYISHVLEVVERVCDRVIVLAEGRVAADANPRELVKLMALPDLEAVFAQLVKQTDTQQTAEQIVDVVRR